MFETTRKYSEMRYYDKQELAEEMDHYMVDPIWHEICQYRSFFRYELPIQGKQTYLVRNCLVNDRMASVQEGCIAWHEQHLQECKASLSFPFLTESQMLAYASLYVRMKYDKGMDGKALIQEVLERFSISISLKLCQYLLQDHHPLLLKLFYLCMECDLRDATVLFYPVLYLHHALAYGALFTIEELKQDEVCSIHCLDLTKNFLSFLSVLQLKLSYEMVSLKLRKQESSKKLDAQDLQEQYPMLPKAAIAFYINHQELHHYYTLQDYQDDAHVCYETARYSMDKLVSLHWYQKQKIGKKFVYYIM